VNFSSASVIPQIDVSFRVLIALGGDDDSLGSFGLSQKSSFGVGAGLLDSCLDDHVGRFGEMLDVIIVAETFISDEQLDTLCFSVGNLSKVSVLVGKFVVGEAGLERVGDDDSAGYQYQAECQNYRDPEH